MIIGILALAVAAFYAGAALYVNLVEQPALQALDDKALLAGWKVSLQRGFLMQAPLCVVGFLLGVIAWAQTHYLSDAIGALAMLANVPWTLAMIAPTNKALQTIDPVAQGPTMRTLIKRWASLHSVRTAFGLLATIAFLQALLPA
jgi:anthrone oxygenase-like protein